MAECGVCGCELGFAELCEADALSDAAWRMVFACHCGVSTLVACRTHLFVQWVNETVAAFRALLEDVDMAEVFVFWDDQRAVEPGEIPVEAVV